MGRLATLPKGVKIGERFPDSERKDNTIFSSGDHIISEWTLKATKAEPFLDGVRGEYAICVQGVSVVQIEHGKIIQWSDYYDLRIHKALSQRDTERTFGFRLKSLCERVWWFWFTGMRCKSAAANLSGTAENRNN